MSVEAPERIWVERDPDTGEKRWFSIKGMGDTEYVRLDKLEELAAALRIAQGNTDAAIEDYNEAKAALAEAKRENEALRRLVSSTHQNAVKHTNCEIIGCVICDGGLFVCADCGAAEIEAEQRICTRNAGGTND